MESYILSTSLRRERGKRFAERNRIFDERISQTRVSREKQRGGRRTNIIAVILLNERYTRLEIKVSQARRREGRRGVELLLFYRKRKRKKKKNTKFPRQRSSLPFRRPPRIFVLVFVVVIGTFQPPPPPRSRNRSSKLIALLLLLFLVLLLLLLLLLLEIRWERASAARSAAVIHLAVVIRP